MIRSFWLLLSRSLSHSHSPRPTGRSSAGRTQPAFRPRRTCRRSGRRTRASSGRPTLPARGVSSPGRRRRQGVRHLQFRHARRPTARPLLRRARPASNSGTASCRRPAEPRATRSRAWPRTRPSRTRPACTRSSRPRDLAAFDADGTLRWYRSLVGDYPTITNQVGMAASPILVKDKLIVPMDNAGESFLAAVDTKYGKNVWKVERKREINWVTPIVREVGGKTEVLFAGSDGLTAYDAADGEKRWTYKAGSGSIPTGVLDGDTLYLPVGGVSQVQLNEQGRRREVRVGRESSCRPGMSSPLVYRGKSVHRERPGADLVRGREDRQGALLGADEGCVLGLAHRRRRQGVLLERDRRLHRTQRRERRRTTCWR